MRSQKEIQNILLHLTNKKTTDEPTWSQRVPVAETY